MAAVVAAVRVALVVAVAMAASPGGLVEALAVAVSAMIVAVAGGVADHGGHTPQSTGHAARIVPRMTGVVHCAFARGSRQTLRASSPSHPVVVGCRGAVGVVGTAAGGVVVAVCVAGGVVAAVGVMVDVVFVMASVVAAVAAAAASRVTGAAVWRTWGIVHTPHSGHTALADSSVAASTSSVQ